MTMKLWAIVAIALSLMASHWQMYEMGADAEREAVQAAAAKQAEEDAMAANRLATAEVKRAETTTTKIIRIREAPDPGKCADVAMPESVVVELGGVHHLQGAGDQPGADKISGASDVAMPHQSLLVGALDTARRLYYSGQLSIRGTAWRPAITRLPIG
ncbi:MAG: hypothetical protein OEZ10_11535 [Gammaproteobacteria bacterium]|nr:hypothetical protein [Gammaproteobacteria bacterium]